MENHNLGRGSFRFMIFLLILNAVALFLLYAVIDVRSLMNTPVGLSLFGLGGILFVIQLLIFILWNGVLTMGWKPTLLVFCANFLITFLAEALGVNFGIIFGNYYYTDLLGSQVFGVPVLIALAWEPILFASFYMTDILIPVGTERSGLSQKWLLFLGLSLVAAFATTAWDVMIDPVAVHRGWWVWRDGGPYTPYIEHGVPISNFIGWLITAFVCQMACRLIKDKGPKPRRSLHLSSYGPIGLYFLLFLQVFGVSLIFLGRPEVAFMGLMAMGPFIIVAVCRVWAVRRNWALTGRSLVGEEELLEKTRPKFGIDL